MIKDYIRPLDSRFMIGNSSMPRPTKFKTNNKVNNNGESTERDINTGDLILTPIADMYETVWFYSLLRDVEYNILYNAIHHKTLAEYKKGFKITTIDSRTLEGSNYKICEYTTYEQDDIESPDVAFNRNGHKYYENVEFRFTSMKHDFKYV